MEVTKIESFDSENLQTQFLQTLYDTGVPLPYFIPKTKKNHYFYKNGLSHIIPRLKVKVHSEIEECYELWEKFTTNKRLFDLWEVRYSFYKGYKCKPFFYTIYENARPLVVLPLWYDDEIKRYEWFGSWWMEDHDFFAVDEKYIDLIFEIIPNPIFLNSIYLPNEKKLEGKRFLKYLKKDDPKNMKDITSFKTIDDYFMQLHKKARYNLKADFRRLSALRPKVIMTEGFDAKCFDQLVYMNKKRFDGIHRERSDFFDEGTIEAIRSMITDAARYKTKFISVYIRGQLASIDLVAQYKDVYYPMLGGNDVNRFKGIGNYMLYTEIDDAIKSGSKLIDCFQIDYGWKHRFFDQVEVFKVDSSLV